MIELTYKEKDGLLIPNLSIPGEKLEIGRYGRMRMNVLREKKRSVLTRLIMTGKLMYHLNQVDEEAHYLWSLKREELETEPDPGRRVQIREETKEAIRELIYG